MPGSTASWGGQAPLRNMPIRRRILASRHKKAGRSTCAPARGHQTTTFKLEANDYSGFQIVTLNRVGIGLGLDVAVTQREFGGLIHGIVQAAESLEGEIPPIDRSVEINAGDLIEIKLGPSDPGPCAQREREGI